MKKIATKQIHENKSANQEIKTDQFNQLNSLVDQQKDVYRSVKAHLNYMKQDISESEEKWASEPETRVKKTIHRTFATKFRDVLRQSQTI